jgi:plastocyanin
VGGLLSPEGGEAVWSAGIAMIIPGSPHTLSLHASNGGATTLQGAAQRKVLGTESSRYGFVFTIPLGSGRQWASIFRRSGSEAPAVPSGADTVVALRNVALDPAEIRIRAGQTVAWLNHDPLVHTITADDGSWDSGDIRPGGTFLRTFAAPGRYTYHCRPHPQMRGVIIVE